ITEQSVHGEMGDSALIRMIPDLRYRPVCHACESPATTVHSQGHRRHLRDLNLAQAQVWLDVEYRKIWGSECGGVRVEHLSFADASKRVTHRLAQYIHDLCKVMTVQDVAEHLELNPKTVKDIDKSFLERSFGQTDGHGLRVLAMDEIALRKGHHYMTVVMDYFMGRIVWMGQGRSQETVDAFFAELTDSQKQGIEAIAIDMWEPYINRIQHHCPDAQIVFDFFHVVQAFGKVIDEVRRDEYLTDDQQNQLEQVLALNEILSVLYVLKAQLKLVYYYSDRRKVKKTLDTWCRMAETIDHPAVRRFIGRLRFFEYGILNHADYPIGTSRLEGANNKIKVIKRKAYGFHDSEYFALKVKQAFAA
ncbi:MAG: ISL3 family transposase, partial [Planctomycetales bacterium]|nr:ISL3 family transposase [Planctomycetales bacterium]